MTEEWDGETMFSPTNVSKLICMWKNSHRVSSECLQRTPDVQKGKPISEGSRAKDKDKQGDRGFLNRDPVLGRESWKRRSYYTIGNPSQAGSGRIFGSSEGSTMRKMEKIHYRDHVKWKISAEKQLKCLCLPTANRGWLQRLGLQGSLFKKKTRANCHEDTLRGLMWHNRGTTTTTRLGPPEWKEHSHARL